MFSFRPVGLSDVVFGFNQGKVVCIDLHDAVTNHKVLDPEYMRLAKVYPALPDAERQRVADLPLREAMKAISTDPVAPVRAKSIGYIPCKETRSKAEETFQKAAKVARDAAKYVRVGATINSSKAGSLIKSLEAALDEIKKLQAADNIVEAG